MSEQSNVLWSVVVPAYSPGENLEIAVRSVLDAMAGRSDFEVVVVDDASPEPIELSDLSPHVRIARMADNVGAVPNFNRSLGEAAGDFIHVLHADDYVQPGFYGAMEKGLKIEGVVAAACGVDRVDGDGALIETMKSERPTAGVWDRAFERLAVANRLPAVSIVARRSTYDITGTFDESLIHAADWDMWIRFSQAGDFYYDPEPLAAYRVHEGQHTAAVSQTGANINEAIEVINRLPGRAESHQADRLMMQALLYRAVYAHRTAQRALRAKNWKVAAVQYRSAATCCIRAVLPGVRSIAQQVRP